MTSKTLEQALRDTHQNRWRYQKSHKSTLSQAEAAVAAITTYTPIGTTPTVENAAGKVADAVALWYSHGVTPATINKRLNCLSAMGVSVQGYRVPKDRTPKWYLTAKDKHTALRWLRRRDGTTKHALADYIEWTTLTGLRLEETLRLTWSDFTLDPRTGRPTEVRVPGTKTNQSQATLPLGLEAADVLTSRGGLAGLRNKSPFAIDYKTLQQEWQELRGAMDWPKKATLKALRRSAARYLHVDCGMPLHMVQQYLRHESLDTTLEYLRLTGGYGTEEMRRYLK